MSRRRRKAAYTAASAAVLADGPVGFVSRVAAIPRMVRDTLSGRYDGMSKGQLLAMAMALAAVYVISPIDLLPEALLTLPGMIDDAAIAAWLIASLVSATGSYRAWEAVGAGPETSTGTPSATVIPGEVVVS